MLGITSAVNTSAPTNIPVGGVIIWTQSALPNGFLLADGSLVNKVDYPALFSALGNTYGTATATQFYLPNLADKFVIGKGSTYNTLGGTGGASSITPSGTNSALTFTGNAVTPTGTVSVTVNNHTLTTSEIPSHSHLMIHNTPATTNALGAITLPHIGRGNVGGMGSSDYGLQGSSGTPNVGSTANTGSGSGHNHGSSGSFSGNSLTPSGSINTPTFTGNSASIINPYIALSYIIKT